MKDPVSRRRMRVDGVPPHVAAMTPSEYRRVSPEERLFIGWQYWCEREGLPLVEEGLVWAKTNDRLHGASWFVRGTDCAFFNGSAMTDSATAFWRYGHMPRELCVAWIQAVKQGIANNGSFAHNDDAAPISRLPKLAEYHWAATYGLPPVGEWEPCDYVDQWRKTHGVRLIDLSRRPELCLFEDTFAFLHLCVQVRRSIRDRYNVVLHRGEFF